ncbi:MAG: gliding motility protein GldM, partial [Crocinitomicaceae bacterium]|nr:gliding motility protein GldM [Crocinitomicaceae bacterium]
MAGGKETPRQKMIGMMYLVLTALLALNVSKQILDAFVAIEENIQRGSITQLERGNAAKSALIEEMSSTAKDESGKAKIEKIKKYL